MFRFVCCSPCCWVSPVPWMSPHPGVCTPTWLTRSFVRWWASCSGRSPSLWCSDRWGRTGRRMSATATGGWIILCAGWVWSGVRLPWCWREERCSCGSPCCPAPAPPSSTRPWRPAGSSGGCRGASSPLSPGWILTLSCGGKNNCHHSVPGSYHCIGVSYYFFLGGAINPSELILDQDNLSKQSFFNLKMSIFQYENGNLLCFLFY